MDNSKFEFLKHKTLKTVCAVKSDNSDIFKFQTVH